MKKNKQQKNKTNRFHQEITNLFAYFNINICDKMNFLFKSQR